MFLQICRKSNWAYLKHIFDTFGPYLYSVFFWFSVKLFLSRTIAPRFLPSVYLYLCCWDFQHRANSRHFAQLVNHRVAFVFAWSGHVFAFWNPKVSRLQFCFLKSNLTIVFKSRFCKFLKSFLPSRILKCVVFELNVRCNRGSECLCPHHASRLKNFGW